MCGISPSRTCGSRRWRFRTTREQVDGSVQGGRGLGTPRPLLWEGEASAEPGLAITALSDVARLAGALEYQDPCHNLTSPVRIRGKITGKVVHPCISFCLQSPRFCLL